MWIQSGFHEQNVIKLFLFCLFFRKRRTSCDVMFSVALMLWLTYHQTTSGDCTNTVITCLSDAAGQRRSRLQPFGLALSTAWALSGGGGGRGAWGLWAPRSMSGRNSHKNSNKCPVIYQNTFGGNWWQRESFLFLNTDEWRKKLGSGRRGTFLIQGENH